MCVPLQNLGKLEWDDSSREDMTTAPLMKKRKLKNKVYTSTKKEKKRKNYRLLNRSLYLKFEF